MNAGIEDGNLADLFGPGARAAGLSDKIAPRRRPAADRPAAAQPPRPAAPIPQESTVPTASIVAKDAKTSKQQQTIYMPSKLAEQVKQRRDAARSTNAGILLHMIEYAIDLEAKDPYKLLRDLINATYVDLPTKTKSLFGRAPERTRETDLGPQSQYVMQLTAREIEILNDLVAQTGAADAGHLATVAAKHYLAKNPT